MLRGRWVPGDTPPGDARHRGRRNPYRARDGPGDVVDTQEVPAVPPFDPQGDERAGYFLAGGLLIAAGWGLALIVNVLLHATAPAGGVHALDGLRVGRGWGPQGLAVALFGAFTGAFGVVLVAFGFGAPKGPLVLPGAEY